MIDLEIKAQGRRLISRTGQHCYVKNRLLSRENEALALPDERKKYSNLLDAEGHSLSKKMSQSDTEFQDRETLFFSEQITDNLSEKMREQFLQFESAIKQRQVEKEKEAHYIRETKTQELRKEYRNNPKEYHNKFEKSTKVNKRPDEPYKSQMFYALKGDEFEAISKKKEKTGKNIVAWRKEPTDPKGRKFTNSALFPLRNMKSLWKAEMGFHPQANAETQKHKEKERKVNNSNDPSKRGKRSTNKKVEIFNPREKDSVLINKNGPNQERFLYNPRAEKKDPFDLTHTKSFPVIDFSKNLCRDSRAFHATMTQLSVIPSQSRLPKKKQGISFDNMLPRFKGSFQLKGHQFKSLEDMILPETVFEKLSTKRRIITPNFDKFKARYRMGQMLPSYMECLNNRTSITGLSYEMLKANSFVENNFNRGDPIDIRPTTTLYLAPDRSHLSVPSKSPVVPKIGVNKPLI